MIDIKWDDKFEIGHTRIDLEHRVFVDLIRSVSIEAERDGSLERVSRLLKEVHKYAEFHFISEENIMLDAKYPDFEHHRQEHDMLLAEFDDRVHRFRNGALDLEQIAHFLFEWFALHTVREDRRISAYLAQGEARLVS